MQTTNTESVKPASIPKEEVKKYDSGKPMVQLVESWFILEVAKVMTFGAKKYGENNWKGMGGDPMRTYGSTMRHLLAYHGGEIDDPESGLPHLAHAATEIMFTMYYEKLGKGEKGVTTFEGPTHRIHVSKVPSSDITTTGEAYTEKVRKLEKCLRESAAAEEAAKGENIITRPPMHGTENYTTATLEAREALINKASEWSQYLRESADAEEAALAKGEGEEQKNEESVRTIVRLPKEYTEGE